MDGVNPVIITRSKTWNVAEDRICYTYRVEGVGEVLEADQDDQASEGAIAAKFLQMMGKPYDAPVDIINNPNIGRRYIRLANAPL